MVERLVSFYTDFTGIDSEFTSPTMGTALNYVKTNLDVSTNQDMYKMQGLCRICKTYVKDSFLSGKSKKKFCKFCYQAVCKSCSPFKLDDSMTKKKNRLCIACFNETLKRYYRITIGPETNQSRNKSLNMIIEENDAELLEVIVEEINRRKKDIENVKKEILALTEEKSETNELSDLGETNEAHKRNLEKMAEDYRKIGTELGVAKKSEKKNRSLIKKLQIEAQSYGDIGQAKPDRRRLSQIDLWNRNSAAIILWDQVVMLRGFKKSILVENEKLIQEQKDQVKIRCVII